MKTTYLTSTELKRKTAEVLNLVAFGDTTAVVERHGEPLVKIIPAREEKGIDLGKKLIKHFGAIPSFPSVSKMRYFRKRNISI